MSKFLSKISFSRLLFSIIFSLALFLMSKIVFLGNVYDDNYMNSIFLSELNILWILIPIIYLLFSLLEKIYNHIASFIITEQEFSHKFIFCCTAYIFLFAVYVTCLFTFYPGGVFIDTWASYRMLVDGGGIYSQQPVLYTLMLNFVKLFSPDIYNGFGVFTFIQISLMIACIVYFLYWLLKKHVNPAIVSVITIFFAIFKLYPLYSISIWKDTPFSIALFMYGLIVVDIIIDLKNSHIPISRIIALNIFTALVILLRSNGLYIVVVCFIAIILTFLSVIRKQKVVHIRPFIIASISTIISCIIIQSLYPVFGITENPFRESVGIPIQQISRVIAFNGNVTDEQLAFIEKIIPAKDIKDRYEALIVDPIKWHSNFNEQFLESHKFEFLKLWFELLFQNPKEYIRAYLLQTSGFWTFNVRGAEGYASYTNWPTLIDILPSRDIIAENSNISFRADFSVSSYYSGGFFFWFMAISMLITFRTCHKKYLLGYLPSLLLWATVMIATPMGSALRYVYILVLMLPFHLIYPAIALNLSNKKQNSNKEKILLSEKNKS